MKRYFLAPRSGEKSYENYLSTLKYGVPYARIAPFLSEEGKKILNEQEVIYAWGNRLARSAEWGRMDIGDTVIFYANKNFVMAGDVIFKQHSDELALAMWPRDENGQPWSYTFYISNLRYFKIPLSVFNALSGYHFTAIMGFTEMNEERKAELLEHYKSFDDLFSAFSDESSNEIPSSEEHIYVNVPPSITPELSTKIVTTYEAPVSNGKVKKNVVAMLTLMK